jgi:EAL domain-containing protein (putative c-di-GMP-specific phosphodiesterase class I)
MTQLKNMPVTKLKIDKSFVDDITTDRNDQAITAAISSLARNLQLQVIAEGVETRQQVLLLRQSGCHEFQGYHFARPLPPAQVPNFIDGFQLRKALGKVDAGGTAYMSDPTAVLAQSYKGTKP